MHTRVVLGVWEIAVLFKEVSSVQGSGREGFHCTYCTQ